MGEPYQLALGCITAFMAIDEASVKPKVMCDVGFTTIQRDGSIVSEDWPDEGRAFIATRFSQPA